MSEKEDYGYRTVKDDFRGEKCPICFNDLNGDSGALCPKHAILICSNYEWLRDYINNLEGFNKDTIYILDDAISNRVSYIINDVEVVNGRLQIKEHLDKELEKSHDKRSPYMERMLREILSLQKAKAKVIEIMNSEIKEVC